jgi:hypothetical protein
MSYNEYGVFGILIFLFVLTFKVVAFIIGCFVSTVGLTLNIMIADDMARSLDRWHNTF